WGGVRSRWGAVCGLAGLMVLLAATSFVVLDAGGWLMPWATMAGVGLASWGGVRWVGWAELLARDGAGSEPDRLG
ncbi:MAG: hypothetical protein SNJ84_09125, partial [Verrucomicrobiia bacterium]